MGRGSWNECAIARQRLPALFYLFIKLLNGAGRSTRPEFKKKPAISGLSFEWWGVRDSNARPPD